MAPLKGQKLKSLLIKDKADIIRKLKSGSSVSAVAKTYGIAKSTVCGIKKKSDFILSNCSNTFSGVGEKKRFKNSEIVKTEDALYKWFLNQRERNAPVNGPILKQKALEFFEKCEGTTGMKFNASDGWLQKFRKRFGLRLLTIAGEKLSSQPELVIPFKKKKKLVEKINDLRLTHHQLYNADETGLMWKMLPDRTYVSKIEKTAPGRKTQKERITVLLCANATGEHKLEPLVVGKAAKPRSFKNFTLPVSYANSKSAWMTSYIFKDWFHKTFVPQVKKYLKENNLPLFAILLIDNATCHASESELVSDDKQIFALFMPPNVTSIIQPMDQNIIRLTKLHYRASLLSKIIAENENSVHETLKKFTLRDATIFLKNAWQKISKDTISKCWKPILTDSDGYSSDDDIPLSVLQANIRQEHIHILEQVTDLLKEFDNQNQYSIVDVQHWDNGENKDSDIEIEESENEDDEPELHKPTINDKEAITIFNKAIAWAGNKGISYDEIQVLQNLREKAVIDAISKTKQKIITDYFK